MERNIDKLRHEIKDLDRELLDLIRRRFKLAEQVGLIKAKQGRPVVVQEVEQRVLDRAREAAQGCGVSPEVMEAIFAAIIQGSVERQHRVGVAHGARGGSRMLVIGAAGAMGQWIRRFLVSIGHTTEGVDPAWIHAPEKGEFSSLSRITDMAAFDAVFVSVRLDATTGVLDELAEYKLSVPVFEIASIKDHLRASIEALSRTGTPVLSIHPMFGPRKNPFESLTVVHAVREDEEKERALILQSLAHPYMDLISMPFERHDRLMGWLLGLAHLNGILFAETLSRSGMDPVEFERAASTTFRRQVVTARSVLEEDPGLYFAIQRLNPYRGEVYAALAESLHEVTGTVERNDCEAFIRALTRASAAVLL
ncbi:MAG: prephenate dehydrogenase/arogenate dehydrogenase family protein [Planctomycetota bacterium]